MFDWLFGFVGVSDGLITYTVEVYEDGKLTQTLSVRAKHGFDAVDKVSDSLPKPTCRQRHIKCLNCIPY
jgi:hypothetical protein